MLLSQWIQRQGHGAITRLASATGLNYTTVFYPCHGDPVKTYDVAKRISAATGGLVSIEELCEPAEDTAQKRKRTVVRSSAKGANP